MYPTGYVNYVLNILIVSLLSVCLQVNSHEFDTSVGIIHKREFEPSLNTFQNYLNE